MTANRSVPSRDDTLKVVKQLEELTTEMQKLSEQITEIVRNDSEPRPYPRPIRPSLVRRA